VSDRKATSGATTGEVPFLFENGGEAGKEDLIFHSTDPGDSNFLLPKTSSLVHDVPGAQGTEKKWVGAIGGK
jgi:hypothetical protein